MALIARDLFSPNMKRTRGVAFENEDEAFELQRKWFIHEKQVIEANPHDRGKICENTVNRLFSGSKSFWLGNTQSSGSESASPSPSDESSILNSDQSDSQESPAQRRITSYFQISTKHSSSAPTESDSSSAMDTDEFDFDTLFKRTLKSFQCKDPSTCKRSLCGHHSRARDASRTPRGCVDRQLTIDSKGSLSASSVTSSSPKTINNRCQCNTENAQLQNCSDCIKVFCDDCLRVCYKCSKLFCRGCRMNSFLHENNKTACYQCLA